MIFVIFFEFQVSYYNPVVFEEVKLTKILNVSFAKSYLWKPEAGTPKYNASLLPRFGLRTSIFGLI
jgi:hypothetical protein